ncbi:MAG TPA: MerC domain-containing protein [Pyrinomonadaceae bacterium]|nr:MerC domain-containing protein [Pyrinomonadaceae bacterium]
MRLNIRSFNANGLGDRVGAALSWLCAVHCLLVPVFISFFPLLGLSFLASEGLEFIFIGLSVLIASITLLPAYFSRHRRIRVLLLFISGIGFILFSDIFFEENLAGKVIFVLAGAALITFSHFLNRRFCLECRNCVH